MIGSMLDTAAVFYMMENPAKRWHLLLWSG